MKINDYKIQKHTKIIYSNASIYQKIFIYKDRGILYLKKNLFTKAIDDFTQNIELSKAVNKKKKSKFIYLYLHMLRIEYQL